MGTKKNKDCSVESLAVEKTTKKKESIRCHFKGLKSFPQFAKVMSLPPDPPHYYDGMSINDIYKKYTNDSYVTSPIKIPE